MKKIIFLFLILFPALAFSESIGLQWDYSTDQTITGFKLFMKKRIQDVYDYDNPVDIIEADKREITIDAPTIEDRVQTYDFVIRAFNEQTESADSNQASYAVVGIKPLTPINLIGQYDSDMSIISLSWEQPPDPYQIWQWTVYYQKDIEAGFIDLGRVDKDQNLNLTTEFNAVAEGETADIQFTVVAFRRDNSVFSENSEVLTLTIDREGPPLPPANLKINVEIPVR